MKSGKALQETLIKIEQGESYSIWNLLPVSAGGQAWLTEIKDAARTLRDWIDPEKNYELDDLRDKVGEIADGETQDYYANINKRVQELGLWAYDEIDQAVAELFYDHYTGDIIPTINDLNSRYLYAGMRILFDAIVDQAYENTEGGEE